MSGVKSNDFDPGLPNNKGESDAAKDSAKESAYEKSYNDTSARERAEALKDKIIDEGKKR